MSDLLLFASEAAAAIGLNPYKKRWEVFESVWQRQDKALWEETLEAAHANQEPHPLELVVAKVVTQLSNQATTTEEVATACNRATQEVEQATVQVLAEVAAAVPDAALAADIAAVKTVEDVERIRKSAAGGAEVEAVLKKAEEVVTVAARVQQKAVSEVRCDFGTRLEERSRTELVKSGKVARVAHDNKFHKKWLGHFENGKRWGVGGRLDGLDDQGRIVEIKNRTRRIFATIPVYEMVQVQVYMQLLDVQETVFVQQFDGKQKTTMVARDDTAWETTYLPALAAFAEMVDMILDEDHVVLRLEWVSSCPETKEAMLSRWIQERRS